MTMKPSTTNWSIEESNDAEAWSGHDWDAAPDWLVDAGNASHHQSMALMPQDTDHDVEVGPSSALDSQGRLHFEKQNTVGMLTEPELLGASRREPDPPEELAIPKLSSPLRISSPLEQNR